MIDFTPVVLRDNANCSIPKAQLLFYDGPAQTFFEPTPPVLNHWSCSNLSDNGGSNTGQDEVRGSVGELNLILFVPKGEKQNSGHLHITWDAQPILPGSYLTHTLYLHSTNRTVTFFPREDTFVEDVHVVAPEGKFVHFWFLEFKFVRFPDIYYDRRSGKCLHGLDIKGSKGNTMLKDNFVLLLGKASSGSTRETA